MSANTYIVSSSFIFQKVSSSPAFKWKGYGNKGVKTLLYKNNMIYGIKAGRLANGIRGASIEWHLCELVSLGVKLPKVRTN